MGYRIDGLKKFMFMDCWTLYILDIEKKILMVLDPIETDSTDEMKRKHDALARKFQLKFCQIFNDIFGVELVDTTGCIFVYPLVAQHKPCTREDSGVYIVHYILEAQLEHLWKKLAYEIVIMKGNKGAPRFPLRGGGLRDMDHEG